MENYKSLIKIISSYILGIVILFFIFSVYLYILKNNFEYGYYIKPLFSGEFIKWFSHFDGKIFIWGLFIPALLEIFFIKHIKKFKIVFISILSILTPFILILFSSTGGSEMDGLAFAMRIELVVPVNFIFSLIYLYYYKYKLEFKKLFSLLFIFIVIPYFISFVFAYSPYYTHPDLTEEIAKFWNLKNSNQDLKIYQNEIQWMREGTINEDTPARWINHFYDPVNKVGWQGKHFGTLNQEEGLYKGESMAPKLAIASIDWVTNQEYQSTYGRQYGNQTWQKAIKSYIDGDKKSAFTALGHILHLIEDVSVPDHTRNDTHADLYGDPGSPYEKYSQEYTNFNKLKIADNLKSKELLNFSAIQDAFNYLADYSNNNFFSEDTISNEEYASPNLKILQIKKENINDEIKSYLYLNGYYLAKKDIDKFNVVYTLNDESFVLPSYFNNLASQAVFTGASVLNLFFQDVEKYKNNPELLPEILPDSNEAILSYLQKSPRLVLINIKNIYDKTSIDSQIYFAQISDFFANTFSNSEQNQLTAQILSNSQISQSDNSASSQTTITINNQNESQSSVELPSLNNQPQQSILVEKQNQIIELQNQLNDIKIQAENINQQISLLSADSTNSINSQTNANNQSISLSGPQIIYGGGGGGGPVVENNSNFENSSSTESVAAISSMQINHIVISEIQAGTDANTDDEFVELYNPTDNNIDLAGFSLKRRVSQNSTSTKNLVLNFPATSTITAKSFFLIGHKDYIGTTTPDLVYSNNSNPLAYTDDIVFLEDSSGAVVDEVYYTEIPKGKSAERKANASSTADSIIIGEDRFLGNGYDINSADDFIIRDIPEPQNSISLPEPRNKSTAPQNFTAQYSSSTSEIILSWQEAQDYSGATSTISYKISEINTASSSVLSDLITTSTIVNVSISEFGRDYQFEAFAIDKDGLNSSASSVQIYIEAPQISNSISPIVLLSQLDESSSTDSFTWIHQELGSGISGKLQSLELKMSSNSACQWFSFQEFDDANYSQQSRSFNSLFGLTVKRADGSVWGYHSCVDLGWEKITIEFDNIEVNSNKYYKLYFETGDNSRKISFKGSVSDSGFGGFKGCNLVNAVSANGWVYSYQDCYEPAFDIYFILNGLQNTALSQ